MLRNLGSWSIFSRSLCLIEKQSRFLIQVSRFSSRNKNINRSWDSYRVQNQRRESEKEKKRLTQEKNIAQDFLSAFGADTEPKKSKTVDIKSKESLKKSKTADIRNKESQDDKTVSNVNTMSESDSKPKMFPPDFRSVETSEFSPSKSMFTNLLLSSLSEGGSEKKDGSEISRMKNLLQSLSVEQKKDVPVTKSKIEDAIIQASRTIMVYRSSDYMYKPLEENIPRSKKKAIMNFVTGPRLGIFAKSSFSNVSEDTFVSIQQKEEIEEIQELCQISGCSQGYEEILRHSDRMWKYPVDNEIVKVEEQDVGFEEHVFLEEYIDEFPDAEPIRRFMELVITGLQQNPYITAKEKRQQIIWFKDYFEQFPKEDLEFS